MFSFISLNWKGQPLVTYETVVNLIGATRIPTGLRVKAQLDPGCMKQDQEAVVAVAHAILRAAYHILARRTTYQDVGSDYFDRRYTARGTRRAVQLLERHGYRVILEPAA